MTSSFPSKEKSLPPDLIKLVLGHLTIEQSIRWLLSSKSLSSFWNSSSYWVIRESSILNIPKEKLQEYINIILDYFSSRHIPYSLPRLIYEMEKRTVWLTVQAIISGINENTIKPLKTVSTYLENSLNILQESSLPQKDEYLSPLRILQKNYDISMEEYFSKILWPLQHFQTSLEKSSGSSLRAEGLRFYSRKFIKNKPQILILPYAFISYLNQPGNMAVRFRDNFQKDYLTRITYKSSPEELKKINRMLDGVQIYDIVVLGPKDSQFKYIYKYYEPENTPFLATQNKFVIPDYMNQLFIDYNIQYNEDLNDLYDTPGAQWRYMTSNNNQILTLASRKDGAKKNVIFHKISSYKTDVKSNETYGFFVKKDF